MLSEKPLSGNADQARAIRTAAGHAPGRIVEAFHYLHHPIHHRLRELVVSGALGDLRRVDLVLATPPPPDTDPRWSWELSGGATIDRGCYVLDAARSLGSWIGAAPRVVSVDATGGWATAPLVHLSIGPLRGDARGRHRPRRLGGHRGLDRRVLPDGRTAPAPHLTFEQVYDYGMLETIPVQAVPLRLYNIAALHSGGLLEGFTRAEALAELAETSTDPHPLAEAAAAHAMADNWYAMHAVDLLIEAGADPELIQDYASGSG